ncbi:MAG: hypothetical protein U1F35_01295 [Steroidobacteraceae bacterium]
MKHGIAMLMGLLAMAAHAETAYVSDDLILGVYAEKNQQGARLTTLHSGAAVEIMAREADQTQIKLANGTQGWVKSSFLTSHETAGVRVKALEEELARMKSTTPAMAEAAARSELEGLRQQLAARQGELDALKSKAPAAPAAAGAQRGWGAVIVASLLCLAAGFAWGYWTLARRIREKFGGVKVF